MYWRPLFEAEGEPSFQGSEAGKIIVPISCVKKLAPLYKDGTIGHKVSRELDKAGYRIKDALALPNTNGEAEPSLSGMIDIPTDTSQALDRSLLSRRICQEAVEAMCRPSEIAIQSEPDQRKHLEAFERLALPRKEFLELGGSGGITKGMLQLTFLAVLENKGVAGPRQCLCSQSWKGGNHGLRLGILFARCITR